MTNKQAYIIRCAPSRISRLNEIIPDNQIVIGWSLTENKLFDESLDRECFKRQLKESYPELYEKNSYSLGQATGHLWRFIREMQIGDYAIVPIPKAFYLGEITSDLIFYKDKIKNDTAIRRDVKWLNNDESIPRDFCGAGLVSRLKYQGTCVGATDLIEDLEKALESVKQKTPSTFKNQLRGSLKENVAKLLDSDKAYLDDGKLEKLVKQLLFALGATACEIPSKKRYKRYGSKIADVDVIANFVHLGLQIYAQVKKHSGETDEHAVKQIIEALKIDNPDNSKPMFGWVISTGTSFSDEAEKLANENGIRIIDIDELAELIVSVGLDKLNEN